MNAISPYRGLTAILVAVLALTSSFTAFADSAEEIEKLLGAQQPERAFKLAQTRDDQEAGDPRFDLAYAQAAIAAGQPSEAVFALERVIAVQPDNHQARLELVRAESMLGNVIGARDALDGFYASKPPQTLRDEADKLAHQLPALPGTTRFGAFAELRYGNDGSDNDFFITSVDMYAPDQLIGVTQVGRGRDNFRQLGLGAQVQAAITSRTDLFGAVTVYDRSNDTNEFQVVDSRSTNELIGTAIRLTPDHTLRFSLQGQQLEIDGNDYRRVETFMPEWTWRLNAADHLFTYAQFGSTRYPLQPVLDMGVRGAGVGLSHYFDPATFSASLYYGDEDADDSIAEFLGREYVGMRVRAQSDFLGAHTGFISVGLQKSDFDADDPFTSEPRHDHYLLIEAGWHWRFADAWTLKTELGKYRNNSNVDVYSYKREIFQVAIRYNFL